MKTISLTLAAALAAGVNASICGQTGYSSQDAYYYDDSDKQGSYASCSKICLDDTSCKSFAFNKNTCMLFSSELAKIFTADDTSSDIFYDRACLSTAKATTATTSTKSAAATSSGFAIPSDCASQVPPVVYINQFSWFNSTHNCDCAASHPDVGDGTGCLSSTTGNWCDPNRDKNCTDCGVPVCYTGLPPQPVGYGPPDTVTIGVEGGFSCTQANPQGFKPREVGQEAMWCGGVSNQMSFIANSEKASSTGVVTYGQYIYCNDNNGTQHTYETFYNGSIPIECKHDAQHNATCTTPEKEVPLTLQGFYLMG
ncbi:hypothetical protein AMS68_007759 [Peltaster fructicola]|uniref:Apple domain-containing protein n=1 Tax=Peltaster fructicola TaxID=286661 RepID=A0A6H0Y5C6_9PEZI|nr:hypothetical protein AMS68_007759 [Peltaster fructicola]